MLDLDPRMLIVENVCGFRKNRPAYFEMVLQMMRDAKFDVEWYETNAKDFGAPTGRRRLFITAVKLRTADLKPTRDKLNADLKGQVAFGKGGGITCRDIAGEIGPFNSLRGYDGAFIHQLRTRPQDKAPHPRIIAIRRDLAVGYGRDKRLGGRYKGLFPTLREPKGGKLLHG
jgi:site-specific DNA-cytosine methylase